MRAAASSSSSASDAKVRAKFNSLVNMSAAEIRAWLRTDESKAVGQRKPGARESIGRQSARKIVRILEGRSDDVKHMRKVVGYIKRHLAQRPAGDVRDTRWAYSLRNWGHNPR